MDWSLIPGQDYRTWTVRFTHDTLSYLTKSSRRQEAMFRPVWIHCRSGMTGLAMTGLSDFRHRLNRSGDYHADMSSVHVTRARSLDYQHVVEVAVRPDVRHVDRRRNTYSTDLDTGQCWEFPRGWPAQVMSRDVNHRIVSDTAPID